MDVPSIVLNNGVSIPQLGLGVFKVPDAEARASVRTAIAAGYRSVDTAAIYGNEAGTGQGIRDSGISRDEMFLTTKVWNRDQGFDATLAAFDRSLEALQTDYVDLYLIHWPVPTRGLYTDTWRAMERLHQEGRARAIGVSNFLPEHLETLIAETDTVPAVNQFELHPQHQQPDVQAFGAAHAVATEAWAPLSRGALLTDPDILRIAAEADRTPAQVILRWHIQHGRIVIPKSVTPSRIAENIAVFDFALDDRQMQMIDGFERAGRMGADPRTFTGED